MTTQGPGRSSLFEMQSNINRMMSSVEVQEAIEENEDNEVQHESAEKKEMRHRYPAEEHTVLYADHIPGKGRGIRASRDIKAGERIWSEVYVGE